MEIEVIEKKREQAKLDVPIVLGGVYEHKVFEDYWMLSKTYRGYVMTLLDSGISAVYPDEDKLKLDLGGFNYVPNVKLVVEKEVD